MKRESARTLFSHDILADMMYSGRSEAIARWSVYVLFALVPLFFVPLPWVSVVQSKALLVAVVITIGLLAWITSALTAASFRFPKSPLLMAAAFIPLAYLVSALATGASWESFTGNGTGQDTVMWFVLLYVAFLVAVEILGSHRSIPALRLFLIGSFIVIAIQVVHLAFSSFTFGGALTVPAASIVGSWHDLGIFLALVIFVSVALARTSVIQGYWNLVGAIVVLGSLFLLVVINFSDVWLGLLGLSIFAVLFSYRASISASFVRQAAPWIACSLIALGMYFGGNTVQAWLPAQLQVIQVEVRPSWQGTFAVGREVFAEPTQIFFGSGPNTFSREWGMHKPLSVNETQFWNTDFSYGIGFIPTSFVTTGILGFLAWGTVCLALLWSLYRSFRDSTENVLRMALGGSALFLTIFHVLYIPGSALSVLTFLVFGALVAEEISIGAVREWVMSLSWDAWMGRLFSAFLIVGSLVVFVGSVQTVRALLSDVFVNRAVVEYNTTQDATKASRAIAWAVGISPQSDRAHRAGVELGLLQLAELSRVEGASEEVRAELQATLTATINHGLEAVSIESRNYQNWLTLARLYGELAGVGIEGAESQAREAYARVRENNPTNPLSYLGEAQLDLAKGDDARAQTNLEEALRVKPNLASVHFLLSQVYARRGDLSKAQEHAVAVVQIAPQDPLGWYNVGTFFYAAGNYQDAALSFERAVTLQNDYANALFLLGLSYYRLERKDDALTALRAVEAFNPGNATLEEAIAQIEGDENLEPVSD